MCLNYVCQHWTDLCKPYTTNVMTRNIPMASCYHKMWAWHASQVMRHHLLCRQLVNCFCCVNIFSLRNMRYKHGSDLQGGMSIQVAANRANPFQPASSLVK